MDCAVGTYSGRESASTCSKCEAGRVAETEGSYRCIKCVEGKIAAFNSSKCVDDTSSPQPVAARQASVLSKIAIVVMRFRLPIARAVFTAEKESSFRWAVAATVKVPDENVTIVSIEEVAARRVASIDITTQIRVTAVTDDAALSSLESSWETNTLNTNLKSKGLPEATFATFSLDSSSQAASKNGGQTASTTPAPTAVGGSVDSTIIIAVVCVVFLLSSVPVFMYYLKKQRKSSSIYPVSSIYPKSPKDKKKFLKKVNKVVERCEERSVHKIAGVLTEDERKALREAIHKHCQNMSPTGMNKFGVGVKDMVTGKFKDAVNGLNALLGLLDDEHLLKSPQNDIEGMEKEIHALNIKEASELIDYVLHQKASEKKYANGIRDRGYVGRTLNDFVNNPIAKKAKLNKAEVAALRIYTSVVFKYINGPLRNSEGKPHPLPITVLLISRALKKLKKVTGREDSGIAEMVLWRGMKNLGPTDEFITEGGKCIISHTVSKVSHSEY
jgi:hypothetical protein